MLEIGVGRRWEIVIEERGKEGRRKRWSRVI